MNGRGVPDYIGFANDYKEILSPDHFIIQVRASDFHYGSHNTNIFGVEIKEGKYHLRKNNDKDADKPSIPSTTLIEFTITIKTNKEKATDS